MMYELTLLLALSYQDHRGATERDLRQLEQQLAARWKASDCAGWGAMLAPEWSVTHITGQVIGKAEALDLCKAPRQPNEGMQVDDLSVRTYGDAAVVTGRTTVNTGGANPSTMALRFTDVFVRRDGQWEVVASHATRLVP